MVAIKVPTFGGIFPQISPRLLPDTAATVAINARLDSGRLSAWRNPVVINDHNSVQFAVPNTTKTIYKHRDRQGNGYWLIWDTEVHAVGSPIAEDPHDRLYWTGQGYPRMALGFQAAIGFATGSRRGHINNRNSQPDNRFGVHRSSDTLCPAEPAYRCKLPG